jgi:hypothetical protein
MPTADLTLPGEPPQAEAYRVKQRDRLAVWLANWLLNHVASEHYRAFVHVIVKRGLEQLPR